MEKNDESEEENELEDLGEYFPEDRRFMLAIVESVISSFIEKVIPDEKKVLSLEKAGKCLSVLGKVWNLSEYPPTSFVAEKLWPDSEERLMDMEGYVDEYQYLHFKAVNMWLTNIIVIPRNFPWLLSVDLSGNSLNNLSACPLTKLPNLVALRLDRNRMEDPYLPPLKHLQLLSLSSNKIKSLHRIYHPNMETLDLNFNLIEEVKPEDCWKLAKLSTLILRGNQLKTTAGIEYFSLVKLYLPQNQITKLEGLDVLVNLEVLHLRENPLSDLSGFSKANVKLRYLNLRMCKIENVEDLNQLKVLQGLRELVIKGNVFNPEREKKVEVVDDKDYDEDDDNDDEDVKTNEEEGEENEEEREAFEAERMLRIQILTYLPQLKRINKEPVTKEELKRMRRFDKEEEDEEQQ